MPKGDINLPTDPAIRPIIDAAGGHNLSYAQEVVMLHLGISEPLKEVAPNVWRA